MIDAALLKQAELAVKTAGPALGAYQAQSAGDVAAADPLIQAIARNRSEYPAHYLLNPFVNGPLGEMAHRFGRRASATRATSPAMSVMSAGFPLNPLSLVGYPVAGAMGGAARQDAARGMYKDHIDRYDGGAEADEADAAAYEELKAQAAAENAARQKQALFSPTGPYAAEQGARVVGADKLQAANLYNRVNHSGRWKFDPFIGGPLASAGIAIAQRQAATQATSPTAAAISNLGPVLGAFADVGMDGSAMDTGLPLGQWAGDVAGDGSDLYSAVLGDASRRHTARQNFGKAVGGGKPAAEPAAKKPAAKKPAAKKDKKPEKKSVKAAAHLVALLA